MLPAGRARPRRARHRVRGVIEVRTARADELDTVVRVLAEAFDDAPVTRWLLPKPADLVPLFDVHVRRTHAAVDAADLAFLDGEPVGAALWDPPGHRLTGRAAVEMGAAYARVLGSRLPLGMLVSRRMSAARPPGEFVHLAEIGSVRSGAGVAPALLEHRLRDEQRPAYLECSNEGAIGLYERFGFEVIDRIELPQGLAMWPMLRA